MEKVNEHHTNSHIGDFKWVYAYTNMTEPTASSAFVCQAQSSATYLQGNGSRFLEDRQDICTTLLIVVKLSFNPHDRL